MNQQIARENSHFRRDIFSGILGPKLFYLPKSFVNELNMMVARFWWGDTIEKKRIHWKAWADMCYSKYDGRLGFRDLEAFNMALLAKQWWRLVHNEDSLIFRVFKEKYFPCGNPSRAKAKSGMSYLWRSLLMGKRVVECGSRWRVGDGNMIDFWKDHWVSGFDNGLAYLVENHQPTSLKVSKLIGDDGQWNREQLEAWLGNEVASSISRIPICPIRMKDELIWIEHPADLFTVRSAYYKARALLNRRGRASHDEQRIWRIIWNANVLPKVKFFMWRLVSNCLPLSSNLLAKGLEVESLCCVCSLQVEDVSHAFGECDVSRLVWKHLGIDWMSQTFPTHNSLSWWRACIMKAHEVNKVEILCTACWCLWKNRNRSFHEQCCGMPRVIADSARDLTHEYLQGNKRPQPERILVEMTWSPPAHGVVKINTDASFSATMGAASLAVVARDSEGEVLGCVVKKQRDKKSALQCEIEAILEGIELAASKGWNRVVLETDSLIANQEILKRGSSLCEWGAIIARIWNIGRCFHECNFVHVKRSANKLAHNLSKLRLEENTLYKSWDYLPANICNPDVI